MQNAAGYGAAPRPTTRMTPIAHGFGPCPPDRARAEQPAAGRTDDRKETSAQTSPASAESSSNIIVLDDVSLRYMKAGAALQACHVNLDIAPALPAAGDDACAASLPALSVRRTAHQVRRPQSTLVRRLLGLRRGPRPLLGVLAAQKPDVHFRAVDANQLASAIGEPGR